MAHYNLIAGQNRERVAALSDGVFAIAMTLLVLDLRLPADQLIQTNTQLWEALVSIAPSLIAYFLSFMTLGIFWIGQQTQLNQFDKTDRSLTWLQLGFLLAVSLIPFTTKILAEFITFRLAIIVYWLNILFLGTMLYISRKYAIKNNLIREGVTKEELTVSERRIVMAELLYTIGAALSFINPFLSIGLIILIQLNFVFAPKIKHLYRI